MKGHMQDGKFHPHTDYKKGVRKSRDQKEKTQGIRKARNKFHPKGYKPPTFGKKKPEGTWEITETSYGSTPESWWNTMDTVDRRSLLAKFEPKWQTHDRKSFQMLNPQEQAWVIGEHKHERKKRFPPFITTEEAKKFSDADIERKIKIHQNAVSQQGKDLAQGHGFDKDEHEATINALNLLVSERAIRNMKNRKARGGNHNPFLDPFDRDASNMHLKDKGHTYFHGGKAYQVDYDQGLGIISVDERYQDKDNKWHTGKNIFFAQGEDGQDIARDAGGYHVDTIMNYLDSAGVLE